MRHRRKLGSRNPSSIPARRNRNASGDSYIRRSINLPSKIPPHQKPHRRSKSNTSRLPLRCGFGLTPSLVRLNRLGSRLRHLSSARWLLGFVCCLFRFNRFRTRRLPLLPLRCDRVSHSRRSKKHRPKQRSSDERDETPPSEPPAPANRRGKLPKGFSKKRRLHNLILLKPVLQYTGGGVADLISVNFTTRST